ncbi:glycosyltransferase [Lacticaseibacillus sp. GG6-2]
MARIVIVGMSANPGGVETYLMNFMQTMVADNDLTFVNIAPEEPLAYADQINAAGAHIFAASGQYSLASYVGRTRQAHKILVHLHADIVYVNALTTNFAYWVRAANQIGAKSVFHSHNDAAVYSSRVKKLVATLIKPANQRVLAGCVQLAASMPAANYMFGPNQHATMIYNAIAPEHWRFQAETRQKMRAELGLAAEAKVIIVVARMHPQKNYPKILNIMAKVRQRDPNARLLVVGDGDERAAVDKQIDALHLRPVVKVLGQRHDVPALMAASDVLLIPSIYEGLPFIVVEAQGAGLPVLASAGVVPEAANVTGEISQTALVEDDDVWAQNVLTLAGKACDRQKMNAQIARSPFALAAYERQIRDIFQF